MNKTIYFLFILLACASAGQQNVEVISADRLIELQEDGVKVIDIRTINEYNQGHIPGVLHIDFLQKDFMERMGELGKDEAIVIHCASGGRTAKASGLLKKAGFKQIYDYSGGFRDWSSKGLEIEKQ